jgi:hypothetical protein
MGDLLKKTIEASLLIQGITLGLNLIAFLIPVDSLDFALKEILGLETAVQIVELLFYSWYRQRLLLNTNDVSRFRYYDWALTTPTMLVSTASYYGYLKEKNEPKQEPFSVWTFLRENASWIGWMLLFNACMLGVGYLQEIGVVSLFVSSVLGYVALLLSFGLMYVQSVSKVSGEQGLFWGMAGTWSLYGVAAALPSVEKNIAYNILDIVAKNFYGLFLGYLILKKRV